MIPTVMCAICGKPVDRLEWFDDLESDDRVIRAHCHGDMDEMRLGTTELIAMSRAPDLSEGVAFATKRIEHE